MRTKIFLDSGDPEETKTAFLLLGYLDGQTTNPSLIAKNPSAQARLAKQNKFTQKEIYSFYQGLIEEIYKIIPNGSISIEVYADKNSTVKHLLNQATEMNRWIPNAHIKLPITSTGLETASILVKNNVRVNMTLCFSQQQAAAVYSATQGAKKGQVFVSPFIGRLDDKGSNGMDLIKNCLKMFESGDGHVEVLAASLRNLGHLFGCFTLGADIVTAPQNLLEEYNKDGNSKNQNFKYDKKDLKTIEYEQLDLNKSWNEFNISHELTNIGINKFCSDWNKLIDLSK